ncbi:hypothetical protein WM40_05785 [Robbsia andropogonis]|uniref:Uncharacterized protein n=2 Tax=Robbsia andropogonis TaxID=28092 RepID=A0A0F5K2S4_9BURK|nr:hypothetical protein WM40_05785 [Robbsia andropogonis]
MEPPMTPETLSSLISLLITSLAFAVVGGFIARDKGRHVTVWTIVCVIPLVNFFCILYLVAASNLRLEQKLDALLAQAGRIDERVGTAGSLGAGLRAETVL